MIATFSKIPHLSHYIHAMKHDKTMKMTKKKLGGRDVKISDMEEEKSYEKERAV